MNGRHNDVLSALSGPNPDNEAAMRSFGRLLHTVQDFYAHSDWLQLLGSPSGPVASQLAIKMLGTNGGGFFNANSAHPFENPDAISNMLQMVSIFAIGAAFTNVFGRMAGSERQGWAILAAMGLLFVVGVAVTYWAEASGNPLMHAFGL